MTRAISEDIEEEDFPNFALLPPDQEGVEGLVVHDYYEQNLNTLIDAVYPGVGGANVTDEYFAERVILAPTNENIWRLNEMVADRLSGETLERLSVDIMEGSDNMLFKPELLRSLNFIFISDDDKDFVFPASTQAVSSISSVRNDDQPSSRKGFTVMVDDSTFEDDAMSTKNIVYREIFTFISSEDSIQLPSAAKAALASSAASCEASGTGCGELCPIARGSGRPQHLYLKIVVIGA
ncbi:hypothetical protein PPTG_21169 [Phytophthora nicotianae INRA-310]|uniref:Uncharacterized protein n=1 Tax=Phytophthora nicotianae (strain INRA-310) TaxID=761204 RepID=W2R954_PHYN3|nr:hypothetical protein PPTG_21169 [Phytophthora nicotianae INRA-310]ETN21938.1 hypothetical protein PPTG_21169 [Phytophthora nicotianae INRA-310]